MYGVGIDIVEPARLRQRLERREELLRELFLPREIEYCFSQHDPHAHLAARFCAKEAVVKALGLEAFDPLEIEVIAGPTAPDVQLCGASARRVSELGVRLIISLTHVKSVASAVAFAVPAV